MFANPVIVIGIVLISGFLASLAMRRIRFPAVTGYLVIGIILGPSVSGILSSELTEQLSGIVTPVALGIIAYMIGGSLPLSSLRGLKRSIAIITLAEGGFACVFVAVLVTFVAPLVLPGTALDFRAFLAMGIIAGGISLATAPAVTMAIIGESKARGPLTTTLLGVVALDDSLAIIAYAIALGVGVSIMSTSGSISMPGMLITELGHIGLSLVLGVVSALLVLWIIRYSRNNQESLIVVLGAILLTAELAAYIGLFPLLANMTLGFVIVNREKPAQNVIGVVHEIQDIIYILFFTIAGSHLDLGIIQSAGILAGLIVLGRCLGKFFGAWLGATVSGAPRVVRRYLGLTLLPKAGVTVGLALMVVETPELQAISNLLVSGVLASTLINELFSPPLSKFALTRSGETGQME